MPLCVLSMQLCFSLCCSKRVEERSIRSTVRWGFCGLETGTCVRQRSRPFSAVAHLGPCQFLPTWTLLLLPPTRRRRRKTPPRIFGGSEIRIFGSTARDLIIRFLPAENASDRRSTWSYRRRPILISDWRRFSCKKSRRNAGQDHRQWHQRNPLRRRCAWRQGSEISGLTAVTGKFSTFSYESFFVCVACCESN